MSLISEICSFDGQCQNAWQDGFSWHHLLIDSDCHSIAIMTVICMILVVAMAIAPVILVVVVIARLHH